MPVLFIGLALVIIFIFIILSSQLRPAETPTLIETGQDELIAKHTNFVGPNNAKLFIVEFVDFESLTCKTYHQTMKELIELYPQHIAWGIRNFPLEKNPNANAAARAAQAAGNQGKYWEFIDILFQNSDKLQEGDFVRYADILGMDLGLFRADFNDQGIASQIQQDIEFGNKIGVNSAPTFFLNGKQLIFKNPADFKTQIEQELTNENVNVIQIQEEKAQKEQGETQQMFADIYYTIDQRFGIKEIEFIENNFKPRNSSATAGQIVRFTNNSQNEITITQIMSKYEALNKDVILLPEESFEFRLELRKY